MKQHLIAKILVTSLMLIFMCSCSLDRKNPLDPMGNPSIHTPPVVTNITLTSQNGRVIATWPHFADSGITKYKLYRSMSHNGLYLKSKDIIPISGDVSVTCIDDENLQINGYYYYKVAGVNAQGLEGPLSAYVGVRVSQ